MARKIRVEYSDAVYHVLNRGDRREPIFKDGLDRYRFLETLGQDCAKTSWAVPPAVERGWCLGDEEFRQELLARMETKMGRHHGGAERRETAQAGRLLASEGVEQGRARGFGCNRATRFIARVSRGMKDGVGSIPSPRGRGLLRQRHLSR